jgi:plastocyanin
MLTMQTCIHRTHPRARVRGIAVALIAGAVLAFANGGASLAAEPAAAPGAVDNTIAIRNFMFEPMSLVVAAGTKVTWKNYDGEPHTIHSIDDAFRSGALDQNDTFSFQFDKPGTYRYVCSIHPQMVATIVVK